MFNFSKRPQQLQKLSTVYRDQSDPKPPWGEEVLSAETDRRVDAVVKSVVGQLPGTRLHSASRWQGICIRERYLLQGHAGAK